MFHDNCTYQNGIEGLPRNNQMLCHLVRGVHMAQGRHRYRTLGFLFYVIGGGLQRFFLLIALRHRERNLGAGPLGAVLYVLFIVQL